MIEGFLHVWQCCIDEPLNRSQYKGFFPRHTHIHTHRLSSHLPTVLWANDWKAQNTAVFLSLSTVPLISCRSSPSPTHNCTLV